MSRPDEALAPGLASARDEGATPTQAPGKGRAGSHTLTGAVEGAYRRGTASRPGAR